MAGGIIVGQEMKSDCSDKTLVLGMCEIQNPG